MKTSSVVGQLFLCVLTTGEKWLYGCWFYRPNETFHLATRKFLEKEVFKSDYYNKAPVSKILGKCVVMFVKVKFSDVLSTACVRRQTAAADEVNVPVVLGILQTSPRRLPTRGRLRLRIALLCQVQVLQEDQTVGHAPELGPLRAQRRSAARGPSGVHVCPQTRRKIPGDRGGQQNDRRSSGQGEYDTVKRTG